MSEERDVIFGYDRKRLGRRLQGVSLLAKLFFDVAGALTIVGVLSQVVSPLMGGLVFVTFVFWALGSLISRALISSDDWLNLSASRAIKLLSGQPPEATVGLGRTKDVTLLVWDILFVIVTTSLVVWLGSPFLAPLLRLLTAGDFGY